MDQEVRASKILLRVLNARERRRYDTFRMLPLDAVQPNMRRRVINDFDVQLYEYENGGDSGDKRRKKSSSRKEGGTTGGRLHQSKPEMVEIKIEDAESETSSEEEGLFVTLLIEWELSRFVITCQGYSCNSV